MGEKKQDYINDKIKLPKKRKRRGRGRRLKKK